jgi:hypothetical protein
MRSIEKLIRDELVAFLSLPERSYYQDDHAELLRMLEAEQWIKDNEWKRACDVFTDYGLTAELCQFIDEFRLWSYEVHGIRADWFYDNYETELPTDDYLRVFGFASPLVLRLEPMLNRCRRIVRRIDELHAKMEQGELVESVKAKEAIDTTEPPGLSPLEHRLFKLLHKVRKQISFDALFDAWYGDPQDDQNVVKSLKRLRDELSRAEYYFEISEAKRLVTWRKKKGQNIP